MKIALLALLISFSAQATEYVKEIYMPNAAGGYMVLTVEDCSIESVKHLFPHRAYATIEGDQIVDEGCWMSPKIDESAAIPGMTIIPIVNTWWSGEIHHFPQTNFSPVKQRWPEFKGGI
jgi:hypothetical protein